MRTISDTIARLSHIKRLRQDFAPSQSPLSPLTQFGTNPGQLRGHYFIPPKFSRNAPLVVVLHGCLQTAASYDHGSGWSKLAAEHGFALLFPEQHRANNPNLCFNWFLREDTRTDWGEVHSIKQMIDRMVSDHQLDSRRIYVTGLSAGGAMAAALLASYPATFAGGGIIAGLAHGVADSIPSAFDRMRGHGLPSNEQLNASLKDASNHIGPWPRLSIWHGSDDRTVVSANATAIVNQWRDVHHLSDRPPTRTTVEGNTCYTWVNDHGQPLVEQYIIHGMGHGTPLDAADGFGIPGPYMIDAGISSTHRIAAFWGIIERRKLSKEPRQPINRGLVTQATWTAPRAGVSANARDGQNASFAAKANTAKSVIEDALRRAGLMK